MHDYLSANEHLFCGANLDIPLSANLGRRRITRYETDAIGLPLHYPVASMRIRADATHPPHIGGTT